MRYLLVLLAAFMLTGCGHEIRPPADAPVAPPSNPLVPPSVAKPPAATDTSEDLKKRLSEVEAARIALDVESQALKRQIVQKEREEHAAEVHRQQVFLYWFSGICLLLGVIAFGLSFAFVSTPLLPVILRWAGAGLGSIGALCLVAAWLLPYLIWVGVALGLGIIGWIIWHARKADKATGQLARAVNDIKGVVPNFKDVFRGHIDTDVDAHLDAVRKRLGL